MASLTINGRSIHADAGDTVLGAARKAGIAIPTLCASPHLKPYGGCRLCLCHVEGQNGLAAACTTPVRDGMAVRSDSEILNRHRRNLIELYLSEQPDRELAASEPLLRLARQFGLHEVRYREPEKRVGAVDASNPYFAFDPAKCIACARCVRVCDEVQGTVALSMAGRGFGTRVIAGNDAGFAASNCVSCGACVKECPTDALYEKAVAEFGRPGSATRTTCTYCGVGCQFDAGLRAGRIVQMLPVDASPVNQGHACMKGRFGWDYLDAPDRLTRPLLRRGGKLVEISWDEAFGVMADHFSRIRDSFGPEALAAISSSRGTNEENYLLAKFVRCVFGTNNIDNCARVCHSATVTGMMETVGASAATNSMDSIEQARLIMVVGANPTEAHPVVGARIKRAARRGTPLIVIDPRRIELANYATLHLRLRPGTNVALLNGLGHVIVTEKLMDQAFIEARTEQYDDWLQTVLPCTPEKTEQITGVPADDIRKAARLYAGSGASMCIHGLGVTEHKFGSHGVIALCNLALATGNIGRPGTGINPLRGQNNVQGACDVGSMPTYFCGYQQFDDPALRELHETVTGRPLPQKRGLKIPDMWDAALEGTLKGLWIIGYDVAQTDPNLKKVRAALEKLQFLVVQDLFMSQTAKYATLILPGAAFVEKDGTYTNLERRVQRVRKVMDPPAGILPDWQVICEVARRMGYPMRYNHPSQVMDEMARLTPMMRGISYERLEAGNGLQWPVPEAGHPGTALMHEQAFPKGRAQFVGVDYLPPGEEPTEEYPFVLVTGRILEHYCSGAQTRRTHIMELVDHDALEIHPDDARRLAVRSGQSVRVISGRSEIVMPVEISERVAPGQLFASFHFPENNLNTLLSSSADEASRCPEYKVSTVRLESLKRPAAGKSR
jgi:formate dehydrogenase major subunit